jgi:hypothetical protein
MAQLTIVLFVDQAPPADSIDKDDIFYFSSFNWKACLWEADGRIVPVLARYEDNHPGVGYPGRLLQSR